MHGIAAQNPTTSAPQRPWPTCQEIFKKHSRSAPLRPWPTCQENFKMHSIVARRSMLSRGHQAAGRHRKCGPENEAENRPEICPARRFHRQCVEPIWWTDLGVDRRFNFFPSDAVRCTPSSRGGQCSPALAHGLRAPAANKPLEPQCDSAVAIFSKGTA